MPNNKINDRLADLIRDLNLNPNSFADRIGVSTPVVYNIVRGRRNKPSFDLLLKILNVYQNINTQWLLKGEGEIWNDKELENRSVPNTVHEVDNHSFDLEPRITILLQNLKADNIDDPNISELEELVGVLIRENNYRREKIMKLFEKNEKLMDVLRKKLGLDI